MSEDPRRQALLATLSMFSEVAGSSRSPRFMQKAGETHGGHRNIWKSAGYPETIGFPEYWALYTRGGVAGRIVDMAPATTWRDAPIITEPGLDDDEETEFTTAVQAIANRTKLWAAMKKADRLSGVGRYAVIVQGFPGDDQSLGNPIEDGAMNGPDDLLYLSVYHEGFAKVKEWVTTTSNERFGLPKTYLVELSSGIDGFTKAQLPLHADRVLHVAEDPIADNVYSRPRLERVYNLLKDLEKVSAATGEGFWQLATRILQAKALPDYEIPDGVAEKTTEQLEEIVHDLRRIFFAEGVELDWLSGDSPDPKEAIDGLTLLLAGGTGFPKRLLFGNETGERSSEQDARTYFGLIQERREQFVEPEMIRPFFDNLIRIGVLPKPDTGEYEVQWHTLFQESDQEIAEANKARAETAKALVPVGGSPLDVATIDDEGIIHLIPTATMEEEAGEPEPVPPEEPLMEDEEA